MNKLFVELLLAFAYTAHTQWHIIKRQLNYPIINYVTLLKSFFIFKILHVSLRVSNWIASLVECLNLTFHFILAFLTIYQKI